MTLKELLTQVGFDELLPHLKRHEPEHLDNLYAFREAYDILRNMEDVYKRQEYVHRLLNVRG